MKNAKFQAAYVLLMLGSLRLWRLLGVRWLGRARLKVVLVAEYAALYAFFLWLLLDSLRRALPRAPEVADMDASALEARFRPVFQATAGLNRTALLSEVDLQPHPLLRWSSIFSPVPVVITWAVCLWDTAQHTCAMWRLHGKRSDIAIRAHDRAVQIIALPTAFALMSLSAVTRAWDVMCNKFSGDLKELSGWDERKKVAMEFYEAHYEIADLYEAWALYQFGRLALEVIRLRFRSMAIMEEGVDPFGPEDDHPDDGMMRLATSMHHSVQMLTMQGIWAFVAVCLVESLYGVGHPLLTLVLTQMNLHKHEHVAPVLRAMESSAAAIQHVFTGMGLVASTAAIGNIVQVEQALHQELGQFKPFWKFWGTKILVSFAFMQQILVMLPIPPFSGMSDMHSRLFYSTALCYECLLVSLLHLHAWRPDEAWYGDDGLPEHRSGLRELELSALKHRSPSAADDNVTMIGTRLGDSL